MRDTELYRYLLGVEEPWTVSRVDLDVRGQRVDIWINHKEGVRWPCPQCSSELGLYDHAEERVWRHLDSCQFLTYLHARIPRVDCSEHGVLQVKVPWAEPRSQFTLLFERLALDLLKECDIQGATDILRISWDEAWHILERAVKRGLQRKGEGVVAHIGIDEKAAAKGHKYLTLVCDLKASTVEYIGDGRKQESLDAYYGGLSESQREGIEAVAMDMWEAYIESTLDHVPGAEDKIVFDRFHILSHMAEAVDTVRKQEHQLLKKQGDETLKGTKYLWLYGQENIPLRRKEEFERLKSLDLKVGRAWAIKENLRRLWDCPSREEATQYWRRWFWWATHSRLEPVKKVAYLIKRHLHNVLTYFTHPITNAVSEGLNSKIQTIKKMAYGFRNPEHFKTAILFHCGGLDIYPC